MDDDQSATPTVIVNGEPMEWRVCKLLEALHTVHRDRAQGTALEGIDLPLTLQYAIEYYAEAMLELKTRRKINFEAWRRTKGLGLDEPTEP